MKALVKVSRGPDGLQIQEMSEPQPRPGHVIVEVEACGICGTDLHIQSGEYPVDPPVILGHEFSGRVAQVAGDVQHVAPGDRVTSLVYFTLCGTCRYCRTGQWNLCARRKSVGSGVNGAFTRYVLLPERNIRPIPDHLDFVAAAMTEPLACCTHAVLEKASPRPTDIILVTGPGAIGLLVCQILIAYGATVILVGTRSDIARLELARRMGVQHTAQVDEGSVSDLVNDLTGGHGVDLAFECSGVAPAMDMALKLLRRGGQLIQVGLFGKPIEIDWDKSMLKEITIINSFASTTTSWEYALDLLSKRLVVTAPLVSEVLPLDDWEEAFTRFRNRQGIKYILTPQG